MTEQLFEECIAGILRGEQSALKQIYEAYLPYIYSIVFQILKNKEDAEDVTSDFFLRIWYTADKFRTGHGHRAYLAVIARNMCIDYLRKHGREIPRDMSGADEASENLNYQETRRHTEEGEPSSMGIADEGFEEELIGDLSLKEALHTLSDSQREVVHLKISGELTFQEIARILKVPVGTVAWRYREAIQKLRRCGFYEKSE